MSIPKINQSEYRFLEILWDHEPLSSAELVRLCLQELEWKKSTTYTVIRRLSDRGVVKSENTIVRSLISREEAREAQSMDLVDGRFAGSLPGFIATFIKSRSLSDREIEEIQEILDQYRKRIPPQGPER